MIVQLVLLRNIHCKKLPFVRKFKFFFIFFSKKLFFFSNKSIHHLGLQDGQSYACNCLSRWELCKTWSACRWSWQTSCHWSSEKKGKKSWGIERAFLLSVGSVAMKTTKQPSPEPWRSCSRLHASARSSWQTPICLSRCPDSQWSTFVSCLHSPESGREKRKSFHKFHLSTLTARMFTYTCTFMTSSFHVARCTPFRTRVMSKKNLRTVVAL